MESQEDSIDWVSSAKEYTNWSAHDIFQNSEGEFLLTGQGMMGVLSIGEVGEDYQVTLNEYPPLFYDTSYPALLCQGDDLYIAGEVYEESMIYLRRIEEGGLGKTIKVPSGGLHSLFLTDAGDLVKIGTYETTVATGGTQNLRLYFMRHPISN